MCGDSLWMETEVRVFAWQMLSIVQPYLFHVKLKETDCHIRLQSKKKNPLQRSCYNECDFLCEGQQPALWRL